jgi:formylglycine-generating enzyme required for sulfatase activity
MNSGGGPTGDNDPATVSQFSLDVFLVTVGRFRQFVKAWNAGWTPPAGAGKHLHLNGGLGLANGASPSTYEMGWSPPDNAKVSLSDATLACDPNYATWFAVNDRLPMNCVNWYEAYAFCVWDTGAFLPSESEWEYAAAGGSAQREYPWGSADPGTLSSYAIYGCYGSGSTGMCRRVPFPIASVGGRTLGFNIWQQFDMAGEVNEWTLDSYAPYANPCVDCAQLGAGCGRVTRGGSFSSPASDLLPEHRTYAPPETRSVGIGFRCARIP